MGRWLGEWVLASTTERDTQGVRGATGDDQRTLYLSVGRCPRQRTLSVEELQSEAVSLCPRRAFRQPTSASNRRW